MVLHRDGGVITLETVARFGLNVPISPSLPPTLPPAPRIHTMLLAVGDRAARKAKIDEWRYLAVDKIYVGAPA